MATNKLKSMPHDLEVEAAVLGCVLIDDKVALEITTAITEEHFYSEANKLIFRACKRLKDEGGKPDAVSVLNFLKQHNALDKVGGAGCLAQTVTALPSAANYEQYLSLLEKNYASRQLIKIGAEISELGYKGSENDNVVEMAQQKIHKLATARNSGGLKQIAQEAAKYMSDVEACQRGEKKENYIKSGFANLDAIIYGFKPCTYTLIAARPSVGKTAFALSIAVNAAVAQKKRVAVFNLEMSSHEIVSRIITNASGVPYSAQRKAGGLYPSQVINMTQAYAALTSAELYLDDSADNSPATVFAKCRQLAANGGLDLVIVDYLGLMTMGGKTESRQQDVTAMSRAMKLFSKELDIPIVVLSQLNRGGELRGGKPELIDLRESGSIEQDADIVMFLQRQKHVNGAARYLQQNVIELFVEKNRNGQRGKAAFEFVGDKQQFLPIAAIEE